VDEADAGPSAKLLPPGAEPSPVTERKRSKEGHVAEGELPALIEEDEEVDNSSSAEYEDDEEDEEEGESELAATEDGAGSTSPAFAWEGEAEAPASITPASSELGSRRQLEPLATSAQAVLKTYGLYGPDQYSKMAPLKLKKRGGASSLPQLPGLSPRKAALEAKRAVRLVAHRALATPPVYKNFKQPTAMEVDLQEQHGKLFDDPELTLKRLKHQRAVYRTKPAPEPKGPCFRGSPGSRSGVVRGTRTAPALEAQRVAKERGAGGLTGSRSAPLLPACGPSAAPEAAPGSEEASTVPQLRAAAAGVGHIRKSTKKLQPLGCDMLKMLHHGTLPSVICSPN